MWTTSPFHVAYSPRDEGDVQGDPGDISFKRANPYRLFPPNPIGTSRCRANRRNQETRRRSVSREASQATDIQHVTYESPRLECVSRVEQLIFSSFPALEVVSNCTSSGLRRPKELLCTSWCNVDARVPQPVLQFSEMVPASRTPFVLSRVLFMRRSSARVVVKTATSRNRRR